VTEENKFDILEVTEQETSGSANHCTTTFSSQWWITATDSC